MSRTEELADNFLTAHSEFRAFVAGATPEQWTARGINHPEIRVGNEDEGRLVGVIVHHVANGYRNNRLRCQAWIRGEDPTPPNSEVNVRHAAENPDPKKDETLRFLDENAAEMEAFIRGLGDAEMAAKGTFVTGVMTVADFVGRTLPYHIRWHMGSIRATWEALAENAARPA